MSAATRSIGAVLLVTGAAQLATGWAGTGALAVLAAAVLVPYGLLQLAARVRLPMAVAAVAVVGLVVAYGYAAGAVAGAGWGAAIRDGVARLLTAPRPAPATADLLLPGVLLAVVIGLFAGIRATVPNGGRFAPLAGASVLYLAGALLSAGQADRNGVVAALLVVCAVIGWAAVERPGQPRSAVLSRATPGLAIAAAVTALVAAILPATGAFEPRELVSPPPEPLVERNPLPRLASWAEQGDEELFRHTAGERQLYLVALSGFDGASWESDARYRPVGAVAPEGLPDGPNRTEVSADVTIATLDGPWLPVPGRPTAASLPAARADTESGSLVLPGGLRPGLRYQVTASVNTPSDAGLVVAAVPDEPDHLQVPRLPVLFAEYLQQTVRGASTPFEQAVVIEEEVREDRRLDPTAPAGSSYARLEMFLFGEEGQPGARVGTPEQFATSFAVLARAAGLPTRVMVGFRPGQQQPDGTWLVRGSDAFAWPEVYFTGHGWVPFDPTPSTEDQTGVGSDTRREVLDRIGENQPPTPGPAPEPVQPAPQATGTPDPEADAQDGGAGALGGFTLTGAAQTAGAGLLVALAVVLLARGRRRRRHRRAGAPGAWSEVLDLLVLIGRRPPQWRTAGWVAEDLAVAVPAGGYHPALLLAERAERAAYAGVQVASPWRELRQLRRLVRRAVPWYRRLTWPVDPRPLWRR